MSILAYWMAALTMVLAGVLAPVTGQGPTATTTCMYPSMHERFGVTVSGDLERFDVSALPAGSYLDWRARTAAPHPNAMRYFPLVRVLPDGIHPSGEALAQAVRSNLGATWMVGNESDTVWLDNVTPEAYARGYHDFVTQIKAIDPTAKFAFTSLATVSTLRLAWLERAWNTYRSLYGADPPVDMWTIHTYVVNEMANQWGAEIPTGIPNAVGYSDGTWTKVAVAGASGGTVHQSQDLGAKAFFAVQGNDITLYLRTGPDSGVVAIYIDNLGAPVDQIDLYASAPGAISRTYSNLTPPEDPRLGLRHSLRVQITGAKNSRSSGIWARVDAVSAASTASLPGGRFEDDSPLVARIVPTVEDHDNVDMIAQQVRDFRQWMADHGQRHKPLVNSEYGILMTEDLGFDYQRVRTFMLESFDRFVNDLKDPQLGLPEDDNRMLQQWFWFALNQDTFEGRVVHTGLYNESTGAIKPLGYDFINYVTPLYDQYADLEVEYLKLDPTWTLFAGQPSRVQVQGKINNQGNAESGAFLTRLSEGASTLRTWNVNSLMQRFQTPSSATVTHDWQPVVTAARTLTLVADGDSRVDDPCRANNTLSATLTPQPFTDLAITDLRTVPTSFPPIPPGQTATVRLEADLRNLGSLGTAAGQITVKFWHGSPTAGGVLIHTATLTPSTTTLPAVVAFDWTNRPPGVYEVVVTVDKAPEESVLINNQRAIRIFLPGSVAYLPFAWRQAAQAVQTQAAVSSEPAGAVFVTGPEAKARFLPR